jgi:hypothetical protein
MLLTAKNADPQMAQISQMNGPVKVHRVKKLAGCHFPSVSSVKSVDALMDFATLGCSVGFEACLPAKRLYSNLSDPKFNSRPCLQPVALR